MRNRTKLSAVLASALLVGCGSKPDVDKPTAKQPKPSLLQSSGVASILPNSTSGVVLMKSVNAFAKLFRLRKILAKYPQVDGIKAMAKGLVGVDIFEPNNWRELGIDPDAPIGVAAVGPLHRNPTPFAIIPIVDGDKLVATLEGIASKMGGMTPAKTTRSGFTVLTLGEANLIVGSEYVMLAPKTDRGDIVSMLVGVTEQSSLASNPNFIAANKEIGGDAYIAGYGDLSYVPQLRAVAMRAQMDTDYAEQRLFLLTDSPIAKIIGKDRSQVVVNATPQMPVMLQVGKIDIPNLLAAVKQYAGREYDQIDRGISGVTGMSFENDILAQFTGEAGLVITGAPKPNATPADMAKAFDATLSIGLTSPDKIRDIFEKVLSAGPAAEYVKKQGDVYSFTVPQWKTIHMKLMDSALVVTSEPSNYDRFAAAIASEQGAKAKSEITEASFVRTIKNPRFVNILKDRNKSIMTMDGKAIAALMRLGLANATGMLYSTKEKKWPAEKRAASATLPTGAAPAPPMPPPPPIDYDALAKKRMAKQIAMMKDLVALYDNMGNFAVSLESIPNGAILTGGSYLEEGNLFDQVGEASEKAVEIGVKLMMGRMSPPQPVMAPTPPTP